MMPKMVGKKFKNFHYLWREVEEETGSAEEQQFDFAH
jgi:hypothetical protein